MAYANSTLVGSAVFAATVFVIILHLAEWLQLRRLSKHLPDKAPSNGVALGLLTLKAGLGIEMVYYFLLLITFTVFFSGNLLFLTLIAVLGVLHLTALQALVDKKGRDFLQTLTTRQVAGVALFDAVELVILIVLAMQFYPFFQLMI